MPWTVGSSRSTRPARSRLAVALGVATLLVAILLQVLAALMAPAVCSAALCNTQETALTVVLEQPAPMPSHVPAMPPQPLNVPAPEPVAENPTEGRITTSEDLPPGDPPARDWNGLAAKASRQHVVDQFRKEREQASRWEKSRSVMFEPSSDVLVAADAAPLMADLHFQAPVRVLGIGITLGRCFVGLPLLGVPLEKRSTSGFTLVVCATESL